MDAKFRVLVFGKAGCDKCKVLHHRLDSLLASGEWGEFEKVGFDLETEDGLVEFCKAECINPQRVPAFVVTRLEASGGKAVPLPAPGPEGYAACGKAGLSAVLGLQTDYGEEGRGLLTPRMIQSVLAEARQA